MQFKLIGAIKHLHIVAKFRSNVYGSITNLSPPSLSPKTVQNVSHISLGERCTKR